MTMDSGNYADRRRAKAYELIGHEGQFRLPGGRTVYSAVLYNEATARGDRVRLARLAADGRRLRQINRWVDWDQQIDVLADEADHTTEQD